MESATNLIFLIAACAARSGGNAVRAPPRAHLAQTVPLVEPAAPGCPSSAQLGRGRFPAHAHPAGFGLAGQAGGSGAGMPAPQPAPAEPGKAQGMPSAWSHLEPEAPGKHDSVTAENSPPSPRATSGHTAVWDLREPPSDRAPHTTQLPYSPNSSEPKLGIMSSLLF